MSKRPRTVLVSPWRLAKQLGRAEGGFGIPGSEGQATAPPGLSMLRDIGSADQAKRGGAWFRKEPRHAREVTRTWRTAELAKLKSRQAANRLGRMGERITAFHGRRELLDHGTRRGMGNLPYFFALLTFTLIEGYLNSLALLVVGESEFRMAYAIGLGLAMMLLARFLGIGLKHRSMKAPDAPSVRVLAVLAASGGALIASLAFLRAEALRLAVLFAVSAAGANSTGSSADTVTTTAVPATSWIWFGILQGVVFVAAVECSRQHAHWLAEERDHLRRGYGRLRLLLGWRLRQEAHAATASESARGGYAAAFAEHLENADEEAHWNAVSQHRYAHHNLLALGGEQGGMSVVPLALDAKEWRSAPVPQDRVGVLATPSPTPLWDDFHIPAPQITSHPNGAHPAVPGAAHRKEDR